MEDYVWVCVCENVCAFIHSGHCYIESLRPLLIKSAPDTARILCRSYTPKRHRRLRVKDLPKAPTWRLERDSSPGGFDFSNAPPRPTYVGVCVFVCVRAYM